LRLGAGRQYKVSQDATLNVEVTSESTAEIDRREKLVAYQKLPGLRAYWIASQDT
jgi:Uma2 family endonuclease